MPFSIFSLSVTIIQKVVIVEIEQVTKNEKKVKWQQKTPKYEERKS